MGGSVAEMAEHLCEVYQVGPFFFLLLTIISSACI